MFEVVYTRPNSDIVRRTMSLLGTKMICDEYAEMDDVKLEFECYENLWHVIAGCSVVASIERLPS
jgi:hypothetical protein